MAVLQRDLHVATLQRVLAVYAAGKEMVAVAAGDYLVGSRSAPGLRRQFTPGSIALSLVLDRKVPGRQ